MTLLYEPELPHACREVLQERIQPTPAPGAVARCTCGDYLVLDDVTGIWKKVGRHSSVVRQAIAHHEERRRRGGET